MFMPVLEGTGVVVSDVGLESLLRRTERRAWVPQAFWMTWFAKKIVSVAEWSNVPSLGLSVLGGEGSFVGYLKRKIRPWMGLCPLVSVC